MKTMRCLTAIGILICFTSFASAQFSESFDDTGPNNTVFYSADPIYSADDVIPSGGNQNGNTPYLNGFVVPMDDTFGLISEDQSGNGNFLWNGTDNASGDDYTGLVWGTDFPIDVNEESSYLVTFYLTNSNFQMNNPAIIQASVNGVALGQGVSALGFFNDGNPNHQWQQFEFIWDSKDATTAQIELRNLRQTGAGNDFGIDTIVFENVLIGDVDCDGIVNLLDVAPFVEAITTGTYDIKADINQDGFVNLLDVGPFVQLLSG